MPPKKSNRKINKNKKGGKKNKIPIDWKADPHFNENRAMIYIEHTNECPIFLEKAQEFQIFLQARYPAKVFQLILNDEGKIEGRSGAFEISVSQNARTEKVDLWSGIDKGPPRREKFPKSYDELLPEIEMIFKKIYVEIKPKIKSQDSLMGFNDEHSIGNMQTIQDATEGDTTT